MRYRYTCIFSYDDCSSILICCFLNFVQDSLIEVANLLFYRGEYYSALSLYNEAMEILKQDDDSLTSRSLISTIHNNMGCIYIRMGKPSDALIHLERSSSHGRIELGSDMNAELSLLNLSISEANVGYVKISQREFHEALVIMEESLLVRSKHEINFKGLMYYNSFLTFLSISINYRCRYKNLS